MRYSHESEALDAWEFLSTTGRWLLFALFDLELDQIDRELAYLARKGVLRLGERSPEH